MITKKLIDLAGNMLQRSYTYYAIGKDIYEYSNQSIKRHMSSLEEAHHPTLNEEETGSQKTSPELDESTIELRRENLKKNLEVPEADNSFIQGKQQSMKASQGISDHSGSSYHGPGKPGDKSNSNMWQRNFENHQGN